VQSDDFYSKPYPVEQYANHLAKYPSNAIPALEAMGFKPLEANELPLQGGMKAGAVLFDDFYPASTITN